MKDTDTILLAEDEDDAAFLLERAIRKAGIVNPLQRVVDGDQTIEYLAGRGNYRDRARYPMPILLLLDINMPRKSGFEVLEWARSDAGLKALTIDIFSGSSRAEDIERALRLGANLYLKKPVALGQMEELLKSYRQLSLSRGFAEA
jgi:CheY-like chemotaxis protein